MGMSVSGGRCHSRRRTDRRCKHRAMVVRVRVVREEIKTRLDLDVGRDRHRLCFHSVARSNSLDDIR